MNIANEILDAIEIIINQKIRENTTQIYFGICKDVNENNCVMSINGKNNTVQFYGSTPTVGLVYRVFVPNGNMSTAFIITNDDGGDTPSATSYNDLTNKPSINGITLIGNKTSNDFGLVSDKTYVHTQATSSDVWTIQHDLDKYPTVTVVDSGNSVVVGEIVYIDKNSIQITFSSAFSGKAFCN